MLVDLSIGRRPVDCIIDVDFIFERSMPEPNTGCWIWLGGYANGICPSMGFEGRIEKVSRVSFEVANGHPPTDGSYVCHRCDLPACVNPGHLWEGSPSDNVQDAISKGRHVAPKRGRHGLAKLTEADVALICADPRASRAVAAEFRVHATTIQRVRAIAAQPGAQQ